nr:hypothetical protein [Tanacetum cinerariifolium]
MVGWMKIQGKIEFLISLEIIEHDRKAWIYRAFMSVDTYDILMNNEFPIFDIWEKIFTKDDALGICFSLEVLRSSSKIEFLIGLEIIEHDSKAWIYRAFMSVDTYDILMNNEFPIFDIWEKIFTKDDALVGVILVNGGYGDATNDLHDV